MAKLFETTRLNGMTLENRFIRSATWTGLAREDGACSLPLTQRMVELVKGGVGLIITGHAYVEKRGQAGPRQLGIDKDELIPGLRQLTTAIHECGGKIVIQLAHAGIYADPRLTGKTPVGPSNRGRFVPYAVREMSTGEIDGVGNAFARVARLIITFFRIFYQIVAIQFHYS